MVERLGQQLGNYRLLRLIGQGGIADVYLGEHLHLKTQAAIKVLHTSLSGEGSEQLRAEALTLAPRRMRLYVCGQSTWRKKRVGFTTTQGAVL